MNIIDPWTVLKLQNFSIHNTKSILLRDDRFFFIWFVFQTMTDVVGNPEEERHADFYYEPWSQEAVCRYFYGKVSYTVLYIPDTFLM